MLTDNKPGLDAHYMKFQSAREMACKEPTLLKALEWIAVWEMERIVKTVCKNPGTWDSCFGYCFEKVMEGYQLEMVREVMES